VTKILTKTSLFFAIGILAVALLFVCSLVAEAQQKGAPEKKGAPAAAPQAAKPDVKAPAPSTTGQPGDEYAGCSPDYASEEIKAMEAFVAELSPELTPKFKAILLKCDFKANDDLLGYISSLQEDMADMEFANAEQEKEYRQEKAKEVEVQIVLSQKPVDQAELKKLVGDLFDLRQKGMQFELADLEKQVELLKKRVGERQQLKDKIVDRKAKELTAGEQPEAEGKEPPPDPLGWD
jgi:hypothetical protein